MAHKSAKGSLPHGWMVKASKSHPDRVYYFNIFTGASTWECPVLIEPEIAKEDLTSKYVSVLNRQSVSFDEESKTEKSVSQDVSTSEGIEIFSNKLEKLKSSEQEEKCLNPPTAVVAPVVLEKRKASPDSLRELINSKYTRKEQPLKKQKIQMSVIETPSTSGSENFNLCSKQHISLEDPIGERLSQAGSFPSSADESCFESDRSDEDMTSNFQSSTFVPFRPIPSTSTSAAVVNFEYDDVEMQDVSADFTANDVSSETQQQESCEPGVNQSYYIVVDTNVLIHDLKQLDEIKDTPVNGCGPPHIFIPNIVFQELDSLKSSGKGYPSRAAAEAVRYLHSILKAKHPRFHGQSAKEAHECAKTYSKCNDDRILECCLTLTETIPREKVVLLTNDKNLANKAFICDISVHDWISLMKELKPDLQIKGKTKTKKEVKKVDSLDPGTLSLSSQKNLERKLVSQRKIHETDIDAIMCSANQLLKNVLDAFLVEEMKEAYKDLWTHFKINRNALKGILDAYLRYWKTVFTLILSDKDKECLELLHSKAKRPEGFYGNAEECSSILKAVAHLLNSVQEKRPEQVIPVLEIKKLIKRCNKKFLKYNNVDSSISVVESAIQNSNCVLEAFNHNWRIVNELCGMIMDCYGVPHNFDYTKPMEFPPLSEFRRVVPDLYPALLQLKQFMKGMLKTVESSTPNQNIFKKFYKALKELVPSIYIQVDIPSLPNFTPKTLEAYCRDPANRQTLERGFEQLDNFCSKLNEALLEMVKKKDHNNSPGTSNSLTSH